MAKTTKQTINHPCPVSRITVGCGSSGRRNRSCTVNRSPCQVSAFFRRHSEGPDRDPPIHPSDSPEGDMGDFTRTDSSSHCFVLGARPQGLDSTCDIEGPCDVTGGVLAAVPAPAAGQWRRALLQHARALKSTRGADSPGQPSGRPSEPPGSMRGGPVPWVRPIFQSTRRLRSTV